MIHHGDCLTILPTLDADSVACVITSPPFWTAHGGGEWGGEPHADPYLTRFARLGLALHRVLHPTGHWWLVLGPQIPWHTLHAVADIGWYVSSANAWDTSVVAHLHRTPASPHLASPPPYGTVCTDQPYAPLARPFVRHCVEASSLVGDLILDPCCGTGTVGIVTGELKRRFRGIEVDGEACTLARARNGLQMSQKHPMKPGL